MASARAFWRWLTSMRTARAFWRWLTSMRTALILLLLLAIAAVPGSLLPQKGVDINRVQQYLTGACRARRTHADGALGDSSERRPHAVPRDGRRLVSIRRPRGI